MPIGQSAVVLIDVWECHSTSRTPVPGRNESFSKRKDTPIIDGLPTARATVDSCPAPNVAKHYSDWHPKPHQTAETATETNQSTQWPPLDFRRKSGLYADFAKPKEARQNEIDHLTANRQMHPDVRPKGTDVVITDGQELHRFCSQRQILFLFYLGFNTNACILDARLRHPRDGHARIWDYRSA